MRTSGIQLPDAGSPVALPRSRVVEEEREELELNVAASQCGVTTLITNQSSGSSALSAPRSIESGM